MSLRTICSSFFLVALLALASGCPGDTRPASLPDIGALPDVARADGPGIDGARVDGPPSDGAKPTPDALPADSVPIDISGPDAPAPSFSDVPASHPAHAAIGWVAGRGIMIGCQAAPPAFCPDDALGRDQLAVSLMRMKYGLNFSFGQTPYFSDVPATHWAFAAIQKLYELQITNGCGSGKFCPSDPTLREQAATFLVRAKFGDTFAYNQTPYFSDVPATHWAFKYVQKLRDEGITLGCGSGKFCPTDPATRAQWAIFLHATQTL